MHFHSLDIHQVRNLAHLSFEPAEAINVISGSNGAGKTSILEAIYLLSSGRSFRTHLINDLIQRNTDHLLVRASFASASSSAHNAGLQKTKNDGLALRLDQQDIKSTAELARLLPVTAIHPDMHDLVRAGPSIRRKFVDWGVFHVEHPFHAQWKRYQFALLQRNNLLKGQFNPTELDAWSEEIVKAGEILHTTREQYLNQLAPEFTQWCEFFALPEVGEIRYKPGWDASRTLDEALMAARGNCVRYKTTTVGPHRADIQIRFGDANARAVVSRGQQKLLVYAIVFAQLALYHRERGERAVLLLDDPESELDHVHRERLLHAIREMRLQCFITGNASDTWPREAEDRMFHVEHGTVSAN